MDKNLVYNRVGSIRIKLIGTSINRREPKGDMLDSFWLPPPILLPPSPPQSIAILLVQEDSKKGSALLDHHCKVVCEDYEDAHYKMSIVASSAL